MNILRYFQFKPYRFRFVPPRAPDTSECCGDGCPNCVWNDYFEKYEKYQMKYRLINSDQQITTLNTITYETNSFWVLKRLEKSEFFELLD